MAVPMSLVAFLFMHSLSLGRSLVKYKDDRIVQVCTTKNLNGPDIKLVRKDW